MPEKELDNMTIKEKFDLWCSFDEETKKELLAITDEKEIEDRFYKDLEFGTGGLRGIMGAGPNRMNKYTIAKVMQNTLKVVLIVKSALLLLTTQEITRSISHRWQQVCWLQMVLKFISITLLCQRLYFHLLQSI